jgi:uncharacterized protein YgiM (DUF1202 family)
MVRKYGMIALVLLTVLGWTSIPVAAAQVGIVWNAEYYNNPILTGPATLTRQETALGFDWVSSSPGTGIQADYFSARFSSDPFFAAGNYRFYALADDKIKLYVDYNLVALIDTMTTPAVNKVAYADIALGQGVHHIQVDYIEETGLAKLFVTWADLATNPSGPNFPVAQPSSPQQPSSGSWMAQYYANPALIGTPTLIQSETSPSKNWGAGSPVASIPVDNFSARWTSVQTVPAGTYQVSVMADDGVRVTIDGVLVINEWHNATAQRTSASLFLSAGPHSFIIEFYEAAGVAFLDFSFTPIGASVATATPFPTSAPPLTGAYMTVTNAYRLNVRGTPDPINGVVLTKISRNESYSIVGRNARSSWWQINVNGIIGWVNASYVTAVNTTNVPITSGSAVVPTSTPIVSACSPAPRLSVGKIGRVTPGLPNNIRSDANTGSTLLGQIPAGSLFFVVSGPTCAGGSYWWQVNYNGVLGWTPEGAGSQYYVEPAS